jgi:hypothetical protein
MKRVLFGMAALTAIAVCSGTASAQAVVLPTYQQPVVSPAVVGGTIVTPGVAVAPTVVVSPPLPIVRVGYPYYWYGRPYYYPYHHYHHRW